MLGGAALPGLTGQALSVLKSRGPMQFADFPGFAMVSPSCLPRLPEAAKAEACEGYLSAVSTIDLAVPAAT
ncbi:hypothetical protein D3C83_288770 [compost metagenome]